MIISEIDLAKMAAYIDGEGCLYCHSRPPSSYNHRITQYHTYGLTIANTDIRLPIWCQEKFKCGTIYSYARKGGRYKHLHTWEVVAKQAISVIKLCLPYFTIKREQALVLIELDSTFTKDSRMITGIKRRNIVKPEVISTREDLYLQLKDLKRSYPQGTFDLVR